LDEVHPALKRQNRQARISGKVRAIRHGVVRCTNALMFGGGEK